MESYVGMIGEGLEGFLPEERHHVYKLLRLGVRFRPEWSLETADVAEEAEAGLPNGKLSPLSV